MDFIQNFIAFVVDRKDQLLSLLLAHLQLTAIAVLVSILVGVPLGILISRYRKLNKPIMGFANVMQAIPSMAIMGFLIPFLGIGRTPAIFMVTLYSLLPIIKNTSTGLNNINKETLEAAKGIGMTDLQILFKVQFPLALPVIMAGVRISAVTAVGLMTLASMIGAGGLGYMIYSGVQMVNTNMILAGAIPACILALLMDALFGKIEKAVTPLSMRSDIVLPTSKTELSKMKRKRKSVLSFVAVLLVFIMAFAILGGEKSKENTVTVVSKNYTEQLLMGNMVADLIEDKTDLTVVRKLNMGGTQVCLNALTSGEADIQVEYTGSMFASVLAQSLSTDPEYIYKTVKDGYKEKFNLNVLGDWGFNNTYALAVTQETAEKYNLKTMSDLVRHAGELTFACPFEFSNREDGLLGIQKTYGMNFGSVINVESGLRYSAIKNGECDVVVAYTTDAQVHENKLVILEDDKNFFLPYHAVPIIRQDTCDKYPDLITILNSLTGELSDETMSELNFKVEIEGKDPAVVAREFLLEKGYISK